MDGEKIAVVTGASSGIGLAISNILCKHNYDVYGFGRDFSRPEAAKLAADNSNFHPVAGDLLDSGELCRQVKQIRKKGKVALLVNNAGVGYYGIHEELQPRQICEMVRVNLETPLLLTNLLLRSLKEQRGFLINISSVTADERNPHGCAYGATKAGLTSFGDSLFEEARKYGVRITTIQPDMTRTKLYRNADFEQGQETESYLTPEQVAEAVEYVITRPEGMVIPKITLRPQIHRIQRKRK